MAFERDAERSEAKLRIALAGLGGTGKTYSALEMAAELEGPIGLLDSEHQSALKCVGRPGIPKFKHEPMHEQSVQEYIRWTDEAAAARLGTFIYDSFSHSWTSALEQVDAMGGNKFSNGWKTISPLYKKLIDKLIAFPGHVIATLRVDAEYAVEKDEKTGKAVPKKIGMAPVARKNTDYEFDFLLEMGTDGNVTVAKTRNGDLLPLGSTFPRTELRAVARRLKAWLSDGAPQSPRDALADRIRFVADTAALDAIRPDIKAQIDAGALTQTDREALLKLFATRKAELAQAAPPEVAL